MGLERTVSTGMVRVLLSTARVIGNRGLENSSRVGWYGETRRGSYRYIGRIVRNRDHQPVPRERLNLHDRGRGAQGRPPDRLAHRGERSKYVTWQSNGAMILK